MEFKGSRQTHAVTSGKLPGTVNYMQGNDPGKWRLALPTFERVTYPEVYPGIDVIYYGNQQQLEFDLVVKPGGDLGAIRLKIDGASKLAIEKSGAVRIDDTKDLTLDLPKIYQDVDESGLRLQGITSYTGKARFLSK